MFICSYIKGLKIVAKQTSEQNTQKFSVLVGSLTSVSTFSNKIIFKYIFCKVRKAFQQRSLCKYSNMDKNN